jgi:hypothetical protein
MSYVFKDAEVVKAEISRLLTVYPEIVEDVELLADSIEGETGLYKILERALSARQEADMMASAIKDREAALKERRERYERQGDAYKYLMLSLMQYAEQDKVTLVEGTLSVTKPRSSVGIEDVNQLPQGFYKTERVADKKAIKEAIDAGAEVPGAYMQTGEAGLTIRVK